MWQFDRKPYTSTSTWKDRSTFQEQERGWSRHRVSQEWRQCKGCLQWWPTGPEHSWQSRRLVTGSINNHNTANGASRPDSILGTQSETKRSQGQRQSHNVDLRSIQTQGWRAALTQHFWDRGWWPWYGLKWGPGPQAGQRQALGDLGPGPWSLWVSSGPGQWGV